MFARFLLPLLLLFAPPVLACGEAPEPCLAAGGEYLVHVPDAPGPHPALIFLHGYGGTGEGVMGQAAMVETALARGFAVIAPQGMPRREGEKGGAWNSFAAPGRRDDVAFLGGVAEDAAARFGLDRAHVLLAGFSGGGMMTWRVACDAPGAFAAFAPVAGLLWRPLPERCAGPFAMLHVHGWSDPVVPLEGRTVGSGQVTQGDLFAGLALLRATLGCARDAPDAFDRKDDFQIRSWTSCAPGARLDFALWPGGHAAPAGWAALALDWFEALTAAD